MLDYKKLSIGLKNSLVYGVINLRYVVGGQTFADIEILDFGNGFGSQAKILSNETEYGSVSSGKFFNTAEEAANDVIALIEKELIADEYVRRCQN
jgi:hypothetical protein